jgi:hypothetical protein
VLGRHPRLAGRGTTAYSTTVAPVSSGTRTNPWASTRFFLRKGCSWMSIKFQSSVLDVGKTASEAVGRW